MGVDDTQPLITHLIELRKRLINSILAILVIFLALVYFANDIYQLVSAPLIRQMPVGATMIADQADLHGIDNFVGAGHFVSGLGLCGASAV